MLAEPHPLPRAAAALDLERWQRDLTSDLAAYQALLSEVDEDGLDKEDEDYRPGAEASFDARAEQAARLDAERMAQPGMTEEFLQLDPKVLRRTLVRAVGREGQIRALLAHRTFQPITREAAGAIVDYSIEHAHVAWTLERDGQQLVGHIRTLNPATCKLREARDDATFINGRLSFVEAAFSDVSLLIRKSTFDQAPPLIQQGFRCLFAIAPSPVKLTTLADRSMRSLCEQQRASTTTGSTPARSSIIYLPQVLEGIGRHPMRHDIGLQHVQLRDAHGHPMCLWQALALFQVKRWRLVDGEPEFYWAPGLDWVVVHPQRDRAPLSHKMCGLIGSDVDMRQDANLLPTVKAPRVSAAEAQHAAAAAAAVAAAAAPAATAADEGASVQQPQQQQDTAGKAASLHVAGEEAKTRQQAGRPKVCSSCGTFNTPTWRTDGHGNRLCNACGLRNKGQQPAPRAMAAVAAAGRASGGGVSGMAPMVDVRLVQQQQNAAGIETSVPQQQEQQQQQQDAAGEEASVQQEQQEEAEADVEGSGEQAAAAQAGGADMMMHTGYDSPLGGGSLAGGALDVQEVASLDGVPVLHLDAQLSVDAQVQARLALKLAPLSEVSKVCSFCGTHVTPYWRTDTRGKPLCNACGLFLARRIKLRPEGSSAAVGGSSSEPGEVATAAAATPSVLPAAPGNGMSAEGVPWQQQQQQQAPHPPNLAGLVLLGAARLQAQQQQQQQQQHNLQLLSASRLQAQNLQLVLLQQQLLRQQQQHGSVRAGAAASVPGGTIGGMLPLPLQPPLAWQLPPGALVQPPPPPAAASQQRQASKRKLKQQQLNHEAVAAGRASGGGVSGAAPIVDAHMLLRLKQSVERQLEQRTAAAAGTANGSGALGAAPARLLQVRAHPQREPSMQENVQPDASSFEPSLKRQRTKQPLDEATNVRVHPMQRRRRTTAAAAGSSVSGWIVE